MNGRPPAGVPQQRLKRPLRRLQREPPRVHDRCSQPARRALAAAELPQQPQRQVIRARGRCPRPRLTPLGLAGLTRPPCQAT
jgi:hypothetical protein